MESVGQLAGGIAHDFNNVLSAIMMATDFLLNAHKPTDPSFQDIMQIKQNANRAASLVRQLLAFSRRQTLAAAGARSRRAAGRPDACCCSRLIGEKVTLDVKHGRDLWPVKADISQFEQVIVNLAVNARDAMPDGGKLDDAHRQRHGGRERRSCAYKGMPAADYVLVEVADTGTGIPPDIIDKIFDPFFSTKEVGKGTGLGLSTVYGIVKQTGGFVYPDSEPGKGTTFRIFLPRHVPDAPRRHCRRRCRRDRALPAIAEAASNARRGRAPPAPPPISPGRAPSCWSRTRRASRAQRPRAGVARLFGAGGRQRRRGDRGAAKNGGQVDLVVSDVVMPEMDGPTLLKELRKRNPELKIIFVSGYAEEAFERACRNGEQFSFLAKPFTLKQLVGAVKETMSA